MIDIPRPLRYRHGLDANLLSSALTQAWENRPCVLHFESPHHPQDRGIARTAWALAALALAALASIAPLGTAGAQTPAPAVKLYIFDLGQLKSANPQPLLDRGVTVTDMSVTAYLIVHPRGTLLWDSGTIPDELVKPEGTTVVRATVKKTLAGQLAEIGYKRPTLPTWRCPHYHYDHSANANAFAGSTWLVQRPSAPRCSPRRHRRIRSIRTSPPNSARSGPARPCCSTATMTCSVTGPW